MYPVSSLFGSLYLFCLISSSGKECEGDLQYYPFRMTPYLMKVQDTVHTEDQFCCLLLAERVHSGYDGKNIEYEYVSPNLASLYQLPIKSRAEFKFLLLL